jgi:flagellar biosynthesis anti-sigma factor FlgM
MTKPASGQPHRIDFSQAGKRRRRQRRSQHQSTVEQSTGKPTEVPNRRTEGLLKSVEQESMVDQEKVRRIKAAITAGTYVVNAETIADKLVELEIELTPPEED